WEACCITIHFLSGRLCTTQTPATHDALTRLRTRVVPATLTAAQTALGRRDAVSWRTAADGQTRWWGQELTPPQGRVRGMVVRTQAGERKARAPFERQAAKAQEVWRKRLWHLSNRLFACEADARAALAQEATTLPAWLKLQPAQVCSEPRYARRG